MARRAPRLAVHIVLETNSLFTEAADRLIRAELSEFILETNRKNEVNVTWHLPEIVRAERKHQMLIRAQRLLVPLGKVESLLGHNFGITSESLEAHVETAINGESERHKLQVEGLDVSKVNWADMVSRSVRRQPPFEPGDKEKGFRDAIVLETFCQLVEELPKSPQNCRIVLMTGDQLLTEAARQRTNNSTNIAFTDDLEAVRTLLNALASTLTQEAVVKILPKAETLFFARGDDKSLYYKWNISDQIAEKFKAQLNGRPGNEFNKLTIKRVLLHAPTFLAKTGQRVRFSSRLIYEMEATKSVWRSQQAPPGLFSAGTSPSSLSGSTGTLLGSGTGMLGTATAAPLGPTEPAGSGLFGLASGASSPAGPKPTGLLTSALNFGSVPPFAPMIPEEVRRNGQHVFEATWDATLTTAGNLTKPKLEGVEWKSTTWEEP
jgi:hypothetical protein